MNDKIIIKGARENNLKNVDLEIPKNKLVILTGLSGSGKTSLAFDTIYAEGQRRYVESLSAYARQFLGGMEKPDVDSIEGLSPVQRLGQSRKSLIIYVCCMPASVMRIVLIIISGLKPRQSNKCVISSMATMIVINCRS